MRRNMARFAAANAMDSDQPTKVGDALLNLALSAGSTTSAAATNFQPTTTDGGE